MVNYQQGVPMLTVFLRQWRALSGKFGDPNTEAPRLRGTDPVRSSTRERVLK